MKTINKSLYKKHNSFVSIKHKNKDSISVALKKIIEIFNEKKYFNNLSNAYKEILNMAYEDLTIPNHSNRKIKFTLSQNVSEEISTFSNEDIPKYLFHRYRYEIFPKTMTSDEYPPYLQIEPSSICNYRCVFCFMTDSTLTDKKNGHMGTMKLDLFKKIIDQAEGNVEFLSLASRGEPMSCPEIIPMLNYTIGKFLNLKINTNASLLNEDKCHAILSGGVKTIVFSADAAEEPLYSKMRVNGNLNKVLKNIELFQEIRNKHYSDSKIISRVSGVKYSDEQNIESMQKLWSSLVDQVVFVKYNPWENSYNTPPNNITLPCSDLWRRMFIWWDGKTNPCDVDYKSKLCVGNYPNSSITELWQSENYQNLRKNHMLSKRSKISPCQSCTVI